MEKIVDYNKKIRETTSDIYRLVSKEVSRISRRNDEARNKYEFLSSLIDYDEESKMIFDILQIPERSLIHTAIVNGIIKYQMYIDYYKKLNLKEKLGNIDLSEKIDLEILRASETPEEIAGLANDFSCGMPIDMFDTMLEYDKTSVFEKILLIKALDYEDISKISSISPFFEVEMTKYNIDINLDFIKDRINRLNTNVFSNNTERTYTEVVDFIGNLMKINPVETKELLDEVVIESDDATYPQESKSATDMKCSYGYVSKNKLKEMLKDMTKENNINIKEKK